MTNYEIASTIFSGISCLVGLVGLISIILMCWQLKLTKEENKRHYEDDKKHYEENRTYYEDIRRNNTVKILSDWNRSLQKETRLAEKIVAKFDDRQCRKLYNYDTLYVDEETHNSLCQICSQMKDSCTRCKKQQDGTYLVDNIPEVELRGYVVSYLNNLEIVSIAWQEHIVDKEMLEAQFSYLCNADKNRSALENFRKIAGNGNAYPVLEAFYSQIKNNSKSQLSKAETKKKL